MQQLQRREQYFVDLQEYSYVHSRRDDVVRALSHVDVIEGVHGFIRADLAAEYLDRTVRNDLRRKAKSDETRRDERIDGERLD